MIFLDTHITVWLYDRRLELLSDKCKAMMEKDSLRISPIVRLELEYLFEIGRIRDHSDIIFDYLCQKIDLQFHSPDFLALINASIKETWTRDPFDRIIVSHARLLNAPLLTRDERILKNYSGAVA